jgi:glycosyltransferase involved in cell wall biosynthesis
MKILFSHYLLDDDCPPLRTNTAITAQLRQLGHEVQLHRSAGPPIAVVAGREGSPQKRPSLVLRLKNKVWFSRTSMRNIGAYRRDMAVLRGYRPDAVLVRHDAYWCSMAWAAERSRVPLVTYVDAPMAYETRLYQMGSRWHPPGLVEWIERQALRPSRALTATSHPTMEKIREDYGITTPISVIPNGLHPERFPVLDESTRRERRSALGVDAPVVVGFQGTFQRFHGVDRLQELMLSLTHRKDVHWLLIGDGPERPALQQGVAGRVQATFMGRQPAESMGALLNLTDIAVVPHNFVNGIFYLSPLKVIESGAAGCAVVASRQGDIPWLLDDGRAGVLVDTPDLSDWTQAIERLADDPGLRRQLGQAAQRYVLERFTWRQIAIQFAEVLAAAVESNAASQTQFNMAPRK